VDLDASLLQMDLGFLDLGDLSDECIPGAPCALTGVSGLAVRGAAAVGIAGAMLEGTVTAPLAEGAPTLLTFSGGVRFDTSRDAIFSFQFRLAYVYRWGVFEGMGGRAGIGIVLRPVWWLAGYAEASAEVTSVPVEMNEAGAILAHTTYLGGGVRVSFGR
jgi:hypothetical protein